MIETLSLLHPKGSNPQYIKMPDETIHDLSIDLICSDITENSEEAEIAENIMSKLCCDKDVMQYRIDVFEDIYSNPKIRERMCKLLDKVDYLKTYSSLNRESDAAGIWMLMHRLAELGDYIDCVEGIYECLNDTSLKSDGLKAVREYVKQIYDENGFVALKKDIEELRQDASKIKSVTLGVNLNARLEPIEIGVNAVNEKWFKESKIIHNLSEFMKEKEEGEGGADWNGKYNFVRAGQKRISHNEISHQFITRGLAYASSESAELIRSMDKTMGFVLRDTCRKLKNKLSEYVSVSINVIVSNLLPEFLFYVRWAEYLEKKQNEGYWFCRPSVLPVQERAMDSHGIYNFKLIGKNKFSEIVPNNVDFTPEHRAYLLTGANRGGKTTITQAVGIAFVMAQAGLYVPANDFAFSPVDNIFTHFPADENKTMDLGRLGEESKRFKEVFRASTSNSLLLLNESFATTSFEEGYYIARGAVRAILEKGCRTIYNTHMHKLALDVDEINGEVNSDSKAASLVVEVENGTRSFRVSVSKPTGLSFAMDIAKKYGVTFEQLMENDVARSASE